MFFFHLVMGMWKEGGDVSSRGAGLDAAWRDGLLCLVLWDDTGSDTRTSGDGLGWDPTWDNEKLTGLLTEKTGRRVKLTVWSAIR